MKIFQVPSPKFSSRNGLAVIAIVHHRMVGNLAGTDITFTTGTRPASTTFGIGYNCGKVGHPIGKAGTHVHQYVKVDQAPWANGNIDASGQWDEAYGMTPNPNWRTISTEHQDNGGNALGNGKGVVPEEVLAMSMELDHLLLTGDWAAWKAAGIRATSDTAGLRVAAQVGKIVPSTKTIVDHNFIAGRLKPYCWKPWSDDKVGFPRARFLTFLTQPATTPTGDDMPALSAYLPGQLATVKVTANVRTAPKLTASVVRGLTVAEKWTIIGFVKGDVDPDGGSDQWLVRWSGTAYEYTAKSNVTSGPTAPVVAPSPAQLLAAKQAGYDLAKTGVKVVVPTPTPSITWPTRP